MNSNTQRNFTQTTRNLVRDEITAAIDKAVLQMGVDPAVVLEILQQVAIDEEQFQSDVQ